ncbi:alpha/beta hydrolase [Kineosporia sp. NBRC 101731]|uniref:alpha/beta fold hydrolase n=1 Tax=Kineosporia sp. NBRC 101731 TaxID=3032199 RepID=UPI0024A459B0|nr:alpha/beta hydrolase [Kineosporia sp. NBRC 101731]GLY28783.1 hydrolase [Kineosporia sp. NBRC 101731]
MNISDVAPPHHLSRRQWLGATVGALALVSVGGLAVVNHQIDSYVDPWQEKVAAAGFLQKTALVNGVNLSYAEGPDHGPALVLLHAQHMDWFSYSRVLPALSRSFHVFDIDYPGHGATTVPEGYAMTVRRIGTDLADFMTATTGPAFVTGNSSGGLLTTWLAANRPDLVRAAMLEDPPLFSSEADRIAGTIADRSFATCADAVAQDVDDFLLFWIDSNSTFFDKHAFKGSAKVLTAAVKSYRGANPGEPVEIRFLPDDTTRLFVRGMDQFDPRFGAAFHDGTWNAGFDHAQALRTITCPVLLLQAETSTLADGTLNGAMTTQDGQRAASLLTHGTYRTIDATHVVHLDQPSAFTQLLEDFFVS